MENKIIGGTQAFICYADDMHPYNCDGMFGGRCKHCERAKAAITTQQLRALR